MAEGTGVALARPEDVANSVSNVSAFDGNGQAFSTVVKIARGLAASTIVPAAYQNNEANCMVALEFSHRLGASVLAVMQNLDIIHGRPGLRSTFLIGTVNATRRFTPLRWRWQGEEGSDEWGARCVANDRESGEECVGPLITIKLAKTEGWYSRSGSKWKTTPELMLMYRSAGWWTRLYAPELSLGLHTSDEVEDFVPSLPTVRAYTIAQALDAGDVAVVRTEEGTPEEEARRLDSMRKAYDVALKSARPDLATDDDIETTLARRQWIQSVTGEHDESKLTTAQYKQLIEALNQPKGREVGSDDED